MSSFSLVDLPDELKIKILQRAADIATLRNVRLLGRDWKRLADDNGVWKKVLKKIDFDFSLKTANLRKDTKVYARTIKDKILRINNTPFYLLKPLHGTTNEYNIKLLVKWLDSKDELIPWEVVANTLELTHFQKDKITKPELANDLAELFPFWTIEHENKFQRVVVLELSHQELYKLTREIGRFKWLQDLDVSYNFLENLPKELEECKQLTSLNLNNNSIKSLPEFIGNFSVLESLKIKKNQLQMLPKSFDKLTNLLTLNLGRNQFSEFPEPILSLTRLDDLTIDHNSISTLPNGIEKLVNLRILEADDNKISRIPKSLGNLRNLRILVLTENPVKTFPEEVRNLPNLTIGLDLEGLFHRYFNR